MQIRVLVVDDNAPFRQIVRTLLGAHRDLAFVAEAKDGAEAVQFAEKLAPDLILLDIGLPKLNGFEAAKRIALLSPLSKVLFLSQEISPDLVEQAFELGACGYVVKSDAARDLSDAVQAVARGDRYLGRRFVDPLRTRLLHDRRKATILGMN